MGRHSCHWPRQQGCRANAGIVHPLPSRDSAWAWLPRARSIRPAALGGSVGTLGCPRPLPKPWHPLGEPPSLEAAGTVSPAGLLASPMDQVSQHRIVTFPTGSPHHTPSPPSRPLIRFRDAAWQRWRCPERPGLGDAISTAPAAPTQHRKHRPKLGGGLTPTSRVQLWCTADSPQRTRPCDRCLSHL